MTEQFTLQELQHMMTLMNCGGYGIGYCMDCVGIRKKIAAMIAEITDVQK